MYASSDTRLPSGFLAGRQSTERSMGSIGIDASDGVDAAGTYVPDGGVRASTASLFSLQGLMSARLDTDSVEYARINK